jgi:hypothetical protein
LLKRQLTKENEIDKLVEMSESLPISKEFKDFFGKKIESNLT